MGRALHFLRIFIIHIEEKDFMIPFMGGKKDRIWETQGVYL